MAFQKLICYHQSNNPKSCDTLEATTAFVTPNLASGPLPFFQFRLRLENVDWRRLDVIDVDKVVETMDVLTLQENITNITFCKLEDEKCPYCQLGVDPLLLKLIWLAQLTIEYLIHSQEFLTLQLSVVEERLHRSLSVCEQNKQLLTKQVDEIRLLKECRREKKMLAAQQLRRGQAKARHYQCHFCDKAFVNQAFLQSHIRHRHLADSCLGRDAKAQNDKLQKDIDMLKEQLQFTKSQLESAQQTHTGSLPKDCEMQKTIENFQKLVARWEEEEKRKLVAEMEKVKEMFMKFKDLTSKNLALQYLLLEIRKTAMRGYFNMKPGETILGLKTDFHSPSFSKICCAPLSARKPVARWISSSQGRIQQVAGSSPQAITPAPSS